MSHLVRGFILLTMLVATSCAKDSETEWNAMGSGALALDAIERYYAYHGKLPETMKSVMQFIPDTNRRDLPRPGDKYSWHIKSTKFSDPWDPKVNVEVTAEDGRSMRRTTYETQIVLFRELGSWSRVLHPTEKPDRLAASAARFALAAVQLRIRLGGKWPSNAEIESLSHRSEGTALPDHFAWKAREIARPSGRWIGVWSSASDQRYMFPPAGPNSDASVLAIDWRYLSRFGDPPRAIEGGGFQFPRDVPRFHLSRASRDEMHWFKSEGFWLQWKIR